ncbi:hypothetical protein ACS0TY_027852 [Phlomoides rotata]
MKMMKVHDRNKLDDNPPNYSPSNEYLTVVLKWGGEMRPQPLARYHGGMVVKLDGVKARNFGEKELLLRHHSYTVVHVRIVKRNMMGIGVLLSMTIVKMRGVVEKAESLELTIRESTTDDDVIFSQNVCVNVEDSESSDHILDEDVVAIEGDFDESKESDEELTGPRYPVFNPDVVFETHFELGMIFSTRLDFKKAKRSVKFTNTAHERVYARRSDKECGWKLNLLKMINEETFQLRVCDDEHTCAPTYEVSNLKSSWLSEKFLKKFTSDPNRRVSGFRQDVIDELEVDVTKDQAYRARRLALKKLEGCPDAQFAKLWDYADQIKRTNPGSTVIVGTEDNEDGEKKFSRFYMCLQAGKSGFRDGCRPIIGVDGCHLKGPHKGILLTVVGVDANNNLYPIAWAVVNTESRETWGWFLICMKYDLGLCRGFEYTFMYEKQKGLIQAFDEQFTNSDHRFCVRHLHSNFKTAGF